MGLRRQGQACGDVALRQADLGPGDLLLQLRTGDRARCDVRHAKRLECLSGLVVSPGRQQETGLQGNLGIGERCLLPSKIAQSGSSFLQQGLGFGILSQLDPARRAGAPRRLDIR